MHYNLFKSRNRAFLEEMTNRTEDMPEVYQAVNTMQNTAFKINTKVYQVANTIFGRGSTVGKLPSTEDTPLPPKPKDIATNADSARDVEVADIDGDGDLDIVSASYNEDTIAR